MTEYYNIRYADTVDSGDVFYWCQHNCRGAWFPSRDWNNWQPSYLNRMMQFTDERDAILFSLRWS